MLAVALRPCRWGFCHLSQRLSEMVPLMTSTRYMASLAQAGTGLGEGGGCQYGSGSGLVPPSAMLGRHSDVLPRSSAARDKRGGGRVSKKGSVCV